MGAAGELRSRHVREALKTMSASKLPNLPETTERRQKLGPRAARPAEPRPDHGTAVLVQEKVIAEISHELGNFFHKLYYWSDYLREKPAHTTADSTAAQMLERTIRNLEEFLKASLDYFHPTQLTFMRMPVGDLMDGLLAQVRAHLNGTPFSVNGREAEPATPEVLIDPGQLSRALEVAVRHLAKQLGPESAVRIAIDPTARRDGRCLEVSFTLERPNDASPLFRTAEAGIEWAVAQKVVALHGGELLESTQQDGDKSLVVFLPLAP
jgi:signal transduction histidine kinase